MRPLFFLVPLTAAVWAAELQAQALSFVTTQEVLECGDDVSCITARRSRLQLLARNRAVHRLSNPPAADLDRVNPSATDPAEQGIATNPGWSINLNLTNPLDNSVSGEVALPGGGEANVKANPLILGFGILCAATRVARAGCVNAVKGLGR